MSRSPEGPIASARSTPALDVGRLAGDRERRAAMLLLLAAFALRIAAARTVSFDSDEPQHLHVVWGWVQGLVPYRDFFDNHAPLFHLLCAPLLRWIGERPDVVEWMRMAMLPLYVGSLWAVYRIGTALRSERIALWGTVLAAVMPNFFDRSLQFRTDDLWALLWLGLLAALVTGRMSGVRAAVAGALAGAALCVSLKTLPLLLSLAGAFAVAVTRPHAPGVPSNRRSHRGHAAIALLAFAAVPTAFVLYFRIEGAWGPLVADVVTHNVLGGLKAPSELVARACVALALGVVVVRHFRRSCADGREVVVSGSAALYLLALLGFWPLITDQDFLPVEPVVALFVAGLLLTWGRRLARRSTRHGPRRAAPAWTAPATLAAALLVSIALHARPWIDGTRPEERLLADVLLLTRPGEPVADRKGETVFRPRSSYYVLERLTRERLARGLVVDDIPERLVRTRTAVAVRFAPPTRRSREFLASHYLPIADDLMVAGSEFARAAERGAGSIPFDVAIPLRYVIVDRDGRVPGRIHGRTIGDGVDLAPGRHVFTPDRPSPRMALVWSRAVERGFNPIAYDARWPR